MKSNVKSFKTTVLAEANVDGDFVVLMSAMMNLPESFTSVGGEIHFLSVS